MYKDLGEIILFRKKLNEIKTTTKNLGILSRGKVRKYVQLNWCFFLKSASVKSLICGCDFVF